MGLDAPGVVWRSLTSQIAPRTSAFDPPVVAIYSYVGEKKNIDASEVSYRADSQGNAEIETEHGFGLTISQAPAWNI
jgi:hypothetical protein